MVAVFSDVLFNLANSQLVQSELRDVLRLPMEHLRVAYKCKVLEGANGINMKYQVRSIWSLAKLGLLSHDITSSIDELFEVDYELKEYAIWENLKVQDY